MIIRQYSANSDDEDEPNERTIGGYNNNNNNNNNNNCNKRAHENTSDTSIKRIRNDMIVRISKHHCQMYIDVNELDSFIYCSNRIHNSPLFCRV
jgi:hypothetical protein